MNRFLIACAIAVAATTAGMGVASAGEPAVKGCMGESVSLHADFQQPYGANVIRNVAPRSGLGSVGDAVQLIQGGVLPDGIYFSTCNP